MDFFKGIFERVAGQHGRKSSIDGVVVALSMLLIGFGEYLSTTHAKELSWGGAAVAGGYIIMKIFRFDSGAKQIKS